MPKLTIMLERPEQRLDLSFPTTVAVNLFNKLAQTALSAKKALPTDDRPAAAETQQNEERRCESAAVPKPAPAPESAPADKPEPAPVPAEPAPCKPMPYRKPQVVNADTRRWLICRCEKCGDTKTIRPKFALATFTCRKCYGRTPLTPEQMIDASWTCDCGFKINADTNISAMDFATACPDCGREAHLRFDGASGTYKKG